MYERSPTRAEVRDARAWYGTDERDPEVVATAILEDLPRVRDGAHATRILARFAVTRFWLLRCDDVDGERLDHARGAAMAHLDAVESGWAEGSRLRRLMARQEPLVIATALLSSAAADAEMDSDVYGAFGLRRAAYRAAIRRLDSARAAEVAGGIEAFLRRRRAREAAESWAGRRRRAEGAASMMSPPSPS